MSAPDVPLRDALRRLSQREMVPLQPAEWAARLDDALGMLKAAGYVAEDGAGANDPDAVMQRALRAHLAFSDAADAFAAVRAEVEQRERTAKAMAAEAKDALRVAMAGAIQQRVEIATHVATMTRPGESLDVHDERAVPGEFFEMEPKRQDQRIKAALQLGQNVPGARLVRGEPGLRVAARK